MADWIGRTLSKVEIQKLLGRGGMAEVYLGRHTTLNRPVAVKILHGHLSGDDTLLGRFRSEAQAVASMRHPNIIQVFDFDIADDQPYIVMELLEGPSLADYLRAMRKSGHKLSPETISRLVMYIAAALDYAHTRGVIHRDVKPSNVLLRREAGLLTPGEQFPDDAQPVLTDFGVARMANATVRTASGVIVGTPAYMSPEQISGETVDARSDIYSLGIMLYEMLSGRLPFDTESETVASTLIKHITEPPPPLPEATPAVQAVVMRALAKDRNARYQTAGDLALDLRGALGLPFTPVEGIIITPSSLRSSEAVTTSLEKSKNRASRTLLTAAVVVVLLVLVAGTLLLFGADLLNRNEEETPAGVSASSAETENFGVLSFGSQSGDVDQVVLTVNGIAPPPVNMLYEAWLLGEETRQLLGVLEVDENGNGQLTYVDEQGKNLFADYARFEITIEPNPDDNPLPTGDVVYSGALPAEATKHIRHLLVAFGGAPNETALVIGILQDAALMETTVQDMLAAQDSGDLVEVRRQAEALVNIIEGEGGEHFGDIDGDGEVTNPTDGFGLLPNSNSSGYIQTAIEHARYSSGTPDTTPNIMENAELLEASAANLGGWAAQIRDAALEVAQSDEPDPERIQQIADLVELFINGQDTNDNDVVEPIAGEGGATTVLQSAQAMAEMVVESEVSQASAAGEAAGHEE